MVVSGLLYYRRFEQLSVKGLCYVVSHTPCHIALTCESHSFQPRCAGVRQDGILAHPGHIALTLGRFGRNVGYNVPAVLLLLGIRPLVTRCYLLAELAIGS